MSFLVAVFCCNTFKQLREITQINKFSTHIIREKEREVSCIDQCLLVPGETPARAQTERNDHEDKITHLREHYEETKMTVTRTTRQLTSCAETR